MMNVSRSDRWFELNGLLISSGLRGMLKEKAIVNET